MTSVIRFDSPRLRAVPYISAVLLRGFRAGFGGGSELANGSAALDAVAGDVAALDGNPGGDNGAEPMPQPPVNIEPGAGGVPPGRCIGGGDDAMPQLPPIIEPCAGTAIDSPKLCTDPAAVLAAALSLPELNPSSGAANAGRGGLDGRLLRLVSCAGLNSRLSARFESDAVADESGLRARSARGDLDRCALV